MERWIMGGRERKCVGGRERVCGSREGIVGE